MQAKVSTLYSTLETKSETYRKVFNNFTSQSAGFVQNCARVQRKCGKYYEKETESEVS